MKFNTFNTFNNVGRRLKDLTGQKFGKWTVIGYAGRFADSTVYHCQCECGTLAMVKARNLANGTSTSCGCKRSLKVKERYDKMREEFQKKINAGSVNAMLSDDDVVERLHRKDIFGVKVKITCRPYVPEHPEQFNDDWMFKSTW